MDAVVAIIGLLTSLVGLATTWLQFQKERQNRPRRDEQLPSQNQHPSATRRGFGCRRVALTMVGMILSLVGIGFFASLLVKIAPGEIAPIPPPETPTPSETANTPNTPELSPEGVGVAPPSTPISPPTLTPTPGPSLNPTSSASPDTDFFTIVGSYQNLEEARARANEIQRNNSDLDIEVFDRYQGSSYFAVMAASWTSRATALEICRIARSRGIAQDAYVWSFSDPYIPCN